MDPKILQALQVIAGSLMASHPTEAQTLMQWVRAGGQGALPASVLTLALPLAPTVGVPATAIMAAIRGTQAGARSEPAPTPTGPGTVGYRGAVAGPSGIGADNPSPFDNNQPGGAPGVGGVAGGPPMQLATAAPGPTGNLGSETTPQSVGLNPAASTGGVRDNNSPGYPGNAPSAGAPTGPPQGSGSSTLPGGFSAATGKYLTEDDSALLRFAMQAAGFNPDVLTPATKIAMKALQGMVQARRAAFGAGTPGQNVGGLPQDIASFAKEYTTPGVDFYGHARDYAQGLLGSQTFQDFAGNLKDTGDQFGMYQAIAPLLYGGANPMIQQSISDQLQRQQGLYSDQQRDNAGTPAGNMSILDFIRNQPNLNPALRSIFGPQR